MKQNPELPGYWELLWMLFMQPISLHHRLKACGIDKPNAPGWQLWRTGGIQRVYALRMLLLLVTAAPMLAGGLGLVFQTLGFEVDWSKLAFGVAFGVALGVALGVVWGVVLGVVWGVASSVASGVDWGVAMGGALAVVFGVAFGVVFGVALGVALGVASGVAAGVAFIVCFFRIPFYLVEYLAEPFFYLSQRLTGKQTLRYAPPLHHDLIYFPLPFLVSHIALTAASNPDMARRALDACAIAPGLKQTGRIALARLQAEELAAYAKSKQFSAAAVLQGAWLPGLEGADPSLAGFADLARYLQAAQQASLAYHRLSHLDKGQQALQALENRLLAERSDLARELRPILPAWRAALEKLRAEAEQQATHEVPNPFRSGNPLEPESGWEVFRGREYLVQRVESLLADAHNAASIALLGPRRCGKTSLLKMLPAMLPDAVVVLFDLQDNPVDSLTGLFEAMDSQARNQARRDRQLELPALDRKRLQTAPFEAAKAWLDALEAALDGRRLLFCIDEFERLEDLFPGPRQDLLKFMGLLRATIQHKRRVRLLVSGAAPFEEWGELWSDHFINTREIAIGHLARDATLGLLTKPFPAFPEQAIPLAVAEAVYERCHGQPYLAQLYGGLLVSRLNDAKRDNIALSDVIPALIPSATLDDVEAVESQVLQQRGYFRQLYSVAPAAARTALDALAQGQPVSLDPPTRRWLERRLLIDEAGKLNIPVLGRWILEEGV